METLQVYSHLRLDRKSKESFSTAQEMFSEMTLNMSCIFTSTTTEDFAPALINSDCYADNALVSQSPTDNRFSDFNSICSAILNSVSSSVAPLKIVFETFQSGFRTHYSTKSTLTTLLYLLTQGTQLYQSYWISLLLSTPSTSAAISHLDEYVGIHGIVLKGFGSYLENRTL